MDNIVSLYPKRGLFERPFIRPVVEIAENAPYILPITEALGYLANEWPIFRKLKLGLDGKYLQFSR
jgi:hypothetical protein